MKHLKSSCRLGAAALSILVLSPALMLAGCERTSVTANPDDPTQVARGGEVYAAQCARCHGAKLEGQADWRKRADNGRIPAPPHDDSGHTWHHPDSVLIGIIQKGMAPPYGPENYVSDMPAFGNTLSDGDIGAVLAYIKSHWSAQSRQVQAQMTAREKDQAQ